jgi:hypothetical protein
MEIAAIKAGQVVLTGMLLAFGFWTARKITNRIDEFLFTNSKEFQELQRQQQKQPLVAI